MAFDVTDGLQVPKDRLLDTGTDNYEFVVMFREPRADADASGFWKGWHLSGICSTMDQAEVLGEGDWRTRRSGFCKAYAYA